MKKMCLSSLFLVAVLALAGCAQLVGPRAVAGVVIENPSEQTCTEDGRPCRVLVHVTVTEGGQCQVTLPGLLKVSGTGADREITWILVNDSQDYTFAFKQLKITNNVGKDPALPEFVRIGISPNQQLIRAFDRRTVFDRTYKYMIELDMIRSPNGAPVSCGFDPGIHNQG